jgi:hypothetical protein
VHHLERGRGCAAPRSVSWSRGVLNGFCGPLPSDVLMPLVSAGSAGPVTSRGLVLPDCEVSGGSGRVKSVNYRLDILSDYVDAERNLPAESSAPSLPP